ncbi:MULTISPECIES: lipopolysaccharide biosynthesis protein [Microbacterium]|uniref:lipopolysaccharide biosynthesis protein n=1 Tax=Microbacterium TaxID=33882 RepID=UPI00146A7208|nr:MULTISPECIES: lipopolysaccharide biosynthesis protein [Microbacterium]
MTTRAIGPLGSRAASSVAWLTGQTWLVKAGGFVTVVILARLLTPTDFGLVAVAMTVVPVVTLIADLGFGTYLMQTPTLTPVAASTAFWYSAGSGVVLAGLLVATAPLMEALFGVPGVAGVIAAMSPAIVFASLAAVPIALLRRELRFRALSIQTAVAALTAQVVAIVLALVGAGVWALVVQISVLQAVTLVAAWVAARWRPQFRFAMAALRTMAAFGTKVVGVNLIATARQWVENAIISNVLGAAALGQLSISQRLVQTSQEVGGAAIAPVSTVVFSQVRDDPERTRRGYGRALGLSYVVIAPSLTFILVSAPVLVPFLFGPQWSSSVAASQALAVAAMFTVAATLDHGLCYGLGRPGTWLAYAVGVDALTILVTALTVSHGIDAVALGFVGVAAVATVARCILVSRLLGAPLWSIARRILAALAVMAGSALVGWVVLNLVGEWPPIASLALVGAVVLVAHVALSRWLMSAALLDLVREARSRLARRGARS